MKRLKKRADFLNVAKGEAVRTPGFILQSLKQDDEISPRVGFTVTKRQGNAVLRNRIKRRLREAVRLAHAEQPFEQADYVVIGRKESLQLSFAELKKAVMKAGRKAARQNLQ